MRRNFSGKKIHTGEKAASVFRSGKTGVNFQEFFTKIKLRVGEYLIITMVIYTKGNIPMIERMDMENTLDKI